MRISTNQFHSQGMDSITNHQAELLKVQEQLSTGKKVNRPGDDPVAMNQIHALNKMINTIDQYERNGQVAKSQLVQEETGIAETIDGIQRARELTIQMMNGTYDEADMKATSAEISQIITQIKNVMNYRTSEGESLFAGNNVHDTAFVNDDNLYENVETGETDQSGFIAYIGSERSDDGTPDTKYRPEANYGARFVQISFDVDDNLTADDMGDAARVRVTDNGANVFQIPEETLPDGTIRQTSLDLYDDGSGETPDNNVLNVLVVLKKYLDEGETPPDVIAEDLDSAIDNLSVVRAEIGGRQNKIESQYDAGQIFQLTLKERRMELEETDIVEAISEFTLKQNALQMAQQIFNKVNGMSLFDYFR